MRIETRIDMEDAHKTPDPASRANQQDQPDCGFGYYEPVMEIALTATAGHAASAIAQGERWVQARHPPRRENAEQQASQQREHGGESQDRAVDRNLFCTRQVGRREAQ